jgi:hypothetical protein
MQRYANLDGDSDIVAFDIGEGSITIERLGGDRYLYTNESAGPSTITRMQELAISGSGLSNFIIREVGDAYASKLDAEPEILTPMQAQEEIRRLRGMVAWEGDLNAMRTDK